MWVRSCVVRCIAAVALSTGACAAAPTAVKATYTAYVNGMAVGTITEHFESDGGTYRIVSETRPVGLAVLAQRQPLRFLSRGELTREGLRPAYFEARRASGDPPQATADFDWTQGQLHLRHSGKAEALPLSPGTQDRLSIMYQFMFVRPGEARHVEFWMTNGRKLDLYRYRLNAEVEVDTPVGRIRTLHLVKQRDAGDTHAEVWLSPQHQHVAVRLLIVEKDGMRFEQLIQSLELRD